MLTRRESQSRCSLVWKKTGCDVSHQQFHRLVEPCSPHQHSCCTAVLNSCDTVSRQKGLVVLVCDLRFKSGDRVEFLRLCSSETRQCAYHCTLDFSDFGVLHGVHQCVLGASRVALQLGCCVLLTEGCDQRGILQHLLSALLLLLTVVAGAVSSDCSIEGVLLSSSSDDALSGGAVRLTVSVSVLQQP